MSNLTNKQEELINNLINEFEKLNPRKELNGSKRFNLSTISEVINEETRLIQTMDKYNSTMKKVFIEQFESEIKDFKKEFGSLFEVQIGYNAYSNNNIIGGMIEWIESKADINHKELNVFIVSKNRKYVDDSRYNYCNGMSYIQLYVDFSKVRQQEVLDTGKCIILHKITGLEFRTRDYLNKDKCYVTLDSLIQNEKFIQQRLVLLSKKNI